MFAGENGNQLPTNDVHLDSPKSSFVIGPDGKVPSLASQVGGPGTSISRKSSPELRILAKTCVGAREFASLVVSP